MQLQADSIDGNVATLEIFHHRVDSLGLAIEPFALGLVVEKQRLRIGLARSAKSLFDIRRTLIRQPDAGLVVPGRIPNLGFLVQTLIHHIPGEDLASVVFHHGGDVLLQQAG
jgi:hypothetical protein